MMRIFYVCDVYLNKPMASTTHVREIIVNLIKFGHEVILYAPGYGKYPGEPFAPTRHVPIINIRIIRVLMFYALMGPVLAVACLRNRPDIIYIREMLVCTPVQLVGKLLRIPVVVEVNGFNDVEMERGGTKSSLEIFVARWMQWLNVHLADRLIAVSPKMEEGLVERGVKPARIVMLRNGANADLFRPVDREEACQGVGLDPACRYVCFTGSFYPFHGVDDLVRAFAIFASQAPEVNLLMVGDGYQRPRIIEQVKELQLDDRVVFTGAVPQPQVPLYINSADLCVAPYNKQLHDVNDLSPLKVFETLACGTPMISTPILGSLLTDADAGVIVPSEDPPALAEAILEMIRDPERRETLGRNGRQFVLDNYTWERTAEHTANVFKTLLPSK